MIKIWNHRYQDWEYQISDLDRVMQVHCATPFVSDVCPDCRESGFSIPVNNKPESEVTEVVEDTEVEGDSESVVAVVKQRGRPRK